MADPTRPHRRDQQGINTDDETVETDETVLTDMAALLGTGRENAVVADRYELHGLLGEGGAAVVHEATDRRLDRAVAVKLLREAATSDEDRARFASEARLLGRLSHPGLVRVLDAGVEGDRPYLVLELVRGQSLADALDVGVDAEETARIGAAVADALAHVHAAGIVHRDVKPGNVLLDEAGTAKLADFGIARLVDDTVHHTRTGMLVGTVAYLAPEQVAGEPVSTAADVYSLGLVLLEALTGVRSYAGSSVESAFARLSRQPQVPTSLPAGWYALLTAMTARNPQERPTAAEVAARLRGGLDVLPAPPVVARTDHRRPLVAAVAAAVLLGALGAAWSLWPGDAPATAAAVRVADRATPSPAQQPAPAPAPASDVTPAVVQPVAVPAAPGTGHTKKHHHAKKHHAKKKHHKAEHHKPKHPKHPPKGHHKGHGPKGGSHEPGPKHHH